MSIFYKSQRIGKDGQPFILWKFRSMVEGVDKMGPLSTGANDPRLTKIGKFIRKWKIDELPQLWNVIKRDMNLVGPRPEVPEVMELMQREYPEDYAIITSTRPGITDWASIWDWDEEVKLAGEADPHQAYLEKIWPTKRRLQVEYVKNHSLWIDIKIIFLTLWRIIKR